MKAGAVAVVLTGAALVAALAACGQQPDHDALSARVTGLERQLQDQQRRQEQVEATVTKALDATTARVDALLQQLAVLAQGGALAAPASAAPLAIEPAPPVATTGPATLPAAVPVEATAHELGAAAEQRGAAFLRNRLQSHTGWLIAVLTVGVTAIGLLAWRLVRQTPRLPQATGSGDANARGDMTTDELWAAAGLLGEAVGRLRSAVPAPAAATAAASADDLDLTAAVRDDVFVLDDDDDALLAAVDWEAVGGDEPGGPAAATGAVTAGAGRAEQAAHARPAAGDAAAAPRAAPLPWTITLDVHDPVTARAAVDAYLRSDPRVLRMPAPVVRSSGEGITVELALLPGLLAGEREHLRSTLQRLLTRC